MVTLKCHFKTWAFIVYKKNPHSYNRLDRRIKMFGDQNISNNMDFDSNIVGDNNVSYNDVDFNLMQNNMGQQMMDSMVPSCEAPRERCIHRTFVHEVPHVCPIKTRIINHHVYRHTYRPEYSCCEENVVSNVQCGSCSQFR